MTVSATELLDVILTGNIIKYSKAFDFLIPINISLNTQLYQWSYNPPGTELLDVILTGTVTTERRKHKLLLVQAATKLIKVETCRHVVVKLFLGSAQQKLTLQLFIDNL